MVTKREPRKVKRVRAWLVISQNGFIMRVELGQANAEQECRLFNGREIKKCWITYTLPSKKRKK